MSAPETITSEIQKLEPSAIIELFELDLTPLGGELLRFHAGTNRLSENLVWQGETYVRYPIQATGFEITGSGQLPRPKIAVSNVLSTISLYVIQYGDLLGAKVTRKRTLAKYLDAVNFPGGVNPTADPTAAFPEDIFYVDRKSVETRDVVEFELATPFDVAGIKLPRRQIVQNICVWAYRGAECGYVGTNYFDKFDNPVATAGQDQCGKRLSSCEKRFGENNPLNFGGFPGAGLVR